MKLDIAPVPVAETWISEREPWVRHVKYANGEVLTFLGESTFPTLPPEKGIYVDSSALRHVGMEFYDSVSNQGLYEDACELMNAIIRLNTVRRKAEREDHDRLRRETPGTRAWRRAQRKLGKIA